MRASRSPSPEAGAGLCFADRAGHIRSILIVKLSSLGDVLLATAVLPFIRSIFPAASVDWVVETEGQEIVRHNPALRRVIIFPRRELAGLLLRHPVRACRVWCAARRDLRAARYDLILDLQGLARSWVVSLMARLEPQGVRAGKGRFPWITYKSPHRRAFLRHAVPSYFEVLAVLGFPAPPLQDMRVSFAPNPDCRALPGLQGKKQRLCAAAGPQDTPAPGEAEDVFKGEEELQGPSQGASASGGSAGSPCRVGDVLEECGSFIMKFPLMPYVVFHAFTTWPAKHWPEEHWVRLAELLYGQGLAERVVISGSRADTARAEALCEKIRLAAAGAVRDKGAPASSWVTNAAGHLSFAELARLAAGARAVISVDSFPMHLAAAAGARVISLHGPSDPARTGPWGKGCRALSAAGEYCPPGACAEPARHSWSADDCLTAAANCGRMPCRRRRCMRRQSQKTACMRLVTPERVFAVCLALLASGDQDIDTQAP
jgi:heptosyltransferase-1